MHRDGDDVHVFTRSLDEITDRVPEVVAAVRAMPAQSLVLDGEALSLDDNGRPRPFQETSSRTATRDADVAAGTALTPFFFDVLHLDGRDLLDAPLRERLAVLDSVAAGHVVQRVVTADPAEAQRQFAAWVAAGQEGVVVKAVDAPYEAGRRGAAWVKVKPRHTLDLVVLAVERGSGRRAGLLSNIHLGARDDAGGFIMLGKTFKGMTDAMLAWQTERFREPGDLGRRLGGAPAAGAGGRGGLRRAAALVAVSGRGRTAVRAGAALPGRQAGGPGRHDRHRPRSGLAVAFVLLAGRDEGRWHDRRDHCATPRRGHRR